MARLLDVWTLSEAMFYFAVYLPRRWHLNQAAEPYMPEPVRTREARRNLLIQTWDASQDPLKYLSGWFYHVPASQLRREDVKDFLCLRLLHRIERTAQDDDELDEYLDYTELVLGMKFKEGSSGHPIMAVTIEPLKMLHRPLIWYLCIGLADIQMSLIMFLHGFELYALPRWFTTLPPRPLSLFVSQRSPSKNISYWNLPHRSNGLPVLFIHGIGIGLHTYMSFFRQLSSQGLGVIAIEIMPISSRITGKMPNKDEIVIQIQLILRKHGWSKCVVMSQSYGSVIATYLLRKDPAMFGPMLFVDPVAFSFHSPQLGFNFLRRKPTTASELQLHYFASTDPDITRAMTRSFIWQENSLWREEIDCNCTVVLSEKDIIVDTLSLGRYLTRSPKVKRRKSNEVDDSWMNEKWRGSGLEVVWEPDLNHAEVYDHRRTRAILIKILHHYSQQVRH